MPTFIDAVVKNSTAVLRWKSNDPRTHSYTLIKTTKESWISSKTQEITGIKGTSYVAKDLQPDVQYKFQVMAVDVNSIASEPTAPADVLFSTPSK
jgi:hypothetical protein